MDRERLLNAERIRQAANSLCVAHAGLEDDDDAAVFANRVIGMMLDAVETVLVTDEAV